MADDEQRPQVKIWDTDSTHESFEKADARRKSLAEDDGPKAVKVHQSGRGFTVKVWHGKTRAAPAPKKKGTEAPLTL
jgi:hypothetical protein